jgi:hypothetical protein
MLMSCTTAAAAHTQQHCHYVTKLNGYITKVGALRQGFAAACKSDKMPPCAESKGLNMLPLFILTPHERC